VKKPVSKFAFQVHNLRRYSAGVRGDDDGGGGGGGETGGGGDDGGSGGGPRLDATARLMLELGLDMGDGTVVGLCTLESS
jgi:hypothetical protein